MRSPGRKTSRGRSSSRRTTASPRPRSTTTLPYSTRLTRPLTMLADAVLELVDTGDRARPRGPSARSPAWPTGRRCGRNRKAAGSRRSSRRSARRGSCGVRPRAGSASRHSRSDRRPAAGATGGSRRFRVDLGADLRLLPVAGAGRLLDRILHGGEDDLAIDHLLTRDCVGDLQKLQAISADGHRRFSSQRDLGCRASGTGSRPRCRRLPRDRARPRRPSGRPWHGAATR